MKNLKWPSGSSATKLLKPLPMAAQKPQNPQTLCCFSQLSRYLLFNQFVIYVKMKEEKAGKKCGKHCSTSLVLNTWNSLINSLTAPCCNILQKTDTRLTLKKFPKYIHYTDHSSYQICCIISAFTELYLIFCGEEYFGEHANSSSLTEHQSTDVRMDFSYADHL